METPSIESQVFLASFMLVLVAGVVVPSAATVVLLWARSRAIVGPMIDEQRPGRALRLALHGVPLLVVLVLVVFEGRLPLLLTAALIALGGLLVALSPGVEDAICGESGVRRGWHARRLEELDEWRLTGEHLRFRLFGEWTAVPLAATEHAAMRARLERACPDRESPFS